MPIIKKPRSGWRATPNLFDYEAVCAPFSWETARSELDGLPEGSGLNIPHEAVDRHACGPRENRVALRWLSRTGQVYDYTYVQMRELSCRFANALQGPGVGKDDPVYTLLGQIPELCITIGEPFKPNAVHWGNEAFGLPLHDNCWQTETGGIMIAKYRTMDIKPGSMGRLIPGIEAAIVHRTENGGVEVLEETNKQGELALRSGWPCMFRGYLGEAERDRRCSADGWYLTGDLARRDEDGYFWFVGRADDVIQSAGHLIGPFEVESVMMEHPAVAEAGVIGKPDPIVGEVVKAFVVLKPGYVMDEALHRQLLAHAHKRLGAAVAPKEIEAQHDLPKTRSGKVMRRLLKSRELGQPDGDLSTLISDE
jgi:acyl-coenzyme A synthetase/AMP-(fatty) acid ligase